MKVFFVLRVLGALHGRAYFPNLPVFAFSVFDNAGKINAINERIDIANSFSFVLKLINM